jgi:hypothetical protein
MRSGDKSLRGALWAIAHSIAAAADAMEAGLIQRLDEIARQEDPAMGYPAQTFTIPERGVIDIVPIPPKSAFGQWRTGVVVEAGTYRIERIADERPEGETS